MSVHRPTGIYRVKMKDGTETVIEYQSKSGYVVRFGSEEYETEEDVEIWYEMIMPSKDWSE